MKNKKYLFITMILAAVAAIYPSGHVFAQNTGASIATIINNADKEIDQRTKNLNDLMLRLGQMKKITSQEETTLTSLVQDEIKTFTNLKAKIDADTNTATAKIDYQSITKSYRIYALVLPQIRIMAASDKVLTIVGSMNLLAGKIQSRMSSVTGDNATTLNQILSDFTAKVADAGTQAQTAAAQVLNLKPDQGDQKVLASNTAALESAREKIKTATSDLVAARKDLGTVVQDLKETNSK